MKVSKKAWSSCTCYIECIFFPSWLRINSFIPSLKDVHRALVWYSGTVLSTESTFGKYLNQSLRALQFDGKVDIHTIENDAIHAISEVYIKCSKKVPFNLTRRIRKSFKWPLTWLSVRTCQTGVTIAIALPAFEPLSTNTLATWYEELLIRKDPFAGKDWRLEEKEMTEGEMVGWHHQLNGHEFEQALGVGDGQGSLTCCNPWGHKELDMTEQLNW